MVAIETWLASMRLVGQYYQEQLALGIRVLGGAGNAPGANGDRRFKAAEWTQNPFFDYLHQSYLQTSQAILDAVELA